MENQLLITDYRIRINPNNICITEVTEWLGADLSKYRTKQHENLKNTSTRGILSPKNIKRIKSAINWLVISSENKVAYSMKTKKKFKFKINFVTLTIPPQQKGMVKEKEFKILLNTWLTYHRKYNKLNNYVWKIETHKDGRLHIHISTDTFIHWQSVNNTWNQILKRNGLLYLHNKKFGNYNPNSTDVHSVQKVRKIAAYIAKYMSKGNKENTAFKGRVWGCSMKISKVINNNLYVCPSIIGKVTKPIFDLGVKMIEVFTEPNYFGNKYKVADIYLLDIADWINLKSGYLYECFKELILFLRGSTQRDSQLSLALIQ